MTDQALIAFLLDRTGSMQSIKEETIGAFNAYLKTLQEDPEGIEFSLITFDSESIDTLYRNAPVKDVASLTEETYVPRAYTPLIDAAMETIRAVETAVKTRDQKPKVMICIQTDGQENASTEHSWEDLRDAIKDKTAKGWQFNFLGAGINAFQQSRRMGIADAQAMSYGLGMAETRAAFAASAENAREFRRGRVASTAYTVGQRSKAGEDKVIGIGRPADPAPTGPDPAITRRTKKQPRILVGVNLG